MTTLPRLVGVLIMVAASLGPQYARAAACLTTDVALTIDGTPYSPTTCADGVNQGGGPTTETSSLLAQLSTTGFVYLDSSEDAGTPAGIGGISFIVSAAGGNSGTWSVSWAEQPGTPNLPLYIDFAVALFGGNNGSGYLFEDVLLTIDPLSGTGTYDINFLNNGGQQPRISHLLLAGKLSDEIVLLECEFCEPLDDTTPSVPEPATLALLGIGLAGLRLSRRKL